MTNEPPDPKRPPADPLEKQVQRVERLAGFGAQLAGALRTEFVYFWEQPSRRAAVPESEAFVAQVDALRQLTARYLRELARAKHLPPMHVHHLLRSLDLKELLESGRGLENQARVLRDRARERGWTGPLRHGGNLPTQPWATADGWIKLFGSAAEPEPAPRAGKGGWLTNRLQSMFDSHNEKSAQPRGIPPVTPPGVRRLQAFESALGLVGEILTDVGPRLAVLRAALAVNAGEEPTGRLPADLKHLVPDVAAALEARPPIAQAAKVAVQQAIQGKRMYEEFKVGLENARKVPLEKVGEALRPFQIDKLKGIVMPLTNLHVTFRGVNGIEVLFPPPLVRRIEAVPVQEGEKRELDPDLVAEPEPVEPEPPPPAPLKLAAQELSERRLSLIMTYMTDPESNPALQDEALVYRLVAEEREYQMDRVIDLRMRIKLMGPPDERDQAQLELRATMEAQMAEAQERQEQLQELLGYVAQSRAGGDEEDDYDEDDEDYDDEEEAEDG